MKQYNNWEEIDKDTDGLVTSLTYIVLFVNDQVYNYALNIYDSCRNTPYYRRGVKKNINDRTIQTFAGLRMSMLKRLRL